MLRRVMPARKRNYVMPFIVAADSRVQTAGTTHSQADPMYPQHFSLKSRPFASGPGDFFLVANDTMATAVTRLQEVLLGRDTVAVVSGGPGVGKSALLAHAAIEAGDRATVAWADLRQVDPEQLFDALILSLGGEPADGSGPLSQHRLAQLLREQHAAGRQVTAAIDLGGITAERAKRLLRLVHMNGEPGGGQLNVVLMGPHTLHKLLDVPGLIHIRQRVSYRHRIRPLNEVETAAYLATRIHAAGGDPKRLLGSDVPPLVYRYVAGVPRLVNTLMEAALATAAESGAQQLRGEIVRATAEALGWKTMGRRRTASPPAAAARTPSPLERAVQREAPPAAAATPAAVTADKSELTSALLASDIRLEDEAASAPKPELAEKLDKLGQSPSVDETSGMPAMSADDPGATGMLRLEDLDERFAESVFGSDN